MIWRLSYNLYERPSTSAFVGSNTERQLDFTVLIFSLDSRLFHSYFSPKLRDKTRNEKPGLEVD